jgi:predicted permease
MRTLWQDLRYGARVLIKHPGFTLVAVLSLALGISANSSIFSVINTALLRPLPVDKPEQLVGLYRKIPQDPNYNRFSYPNYTEVRERQHVFTDLASYYFTAFNLSGGGETERVWGQIVSGNYFSVLGIAPAIGRAFAPEEDRTPGSHPVAVLSHGLWRRRFGSDPGLVGQTITLNGYAFTVIGVMPPQLQGVELGMVPDVYVPMMMQARAMPGNNWLADRGIGWLRVLGRLKSEVGVAQAQAEMNLLSDQLRREHPKINETFGIAVIEDFGIHPQFRGTARTFLLVLMAVVGLVLLIACSNVAGLLLARAAERQGEIGLRLALGASRSRLIRQLLTESLLLATIGGVLGMVCAPWISDALATVMQEASLMPSPVAFQIDQRVLFFTTILTMLTGIIFGLVPAISTARVDLIKIIKSDDAGRSPGKGKLGAFFVCAQAAISLVLLVTAGLFIRSLQQAQRIDVGFESERQLLMAFDLGLQGYNEERGKEFFKQLAQRVSGLPGVESMALASVLPVGAGSDQDRGITVDGYRPPSGLEIMPINFNIVGGRYFQTMGIPLVAGRDFGGQEQEKSPPVAIVNETAAQRFWPGKSAIGQHVRYGSDGPEVEIVGIARDSKYLTLGEEPLPFIYSPMSQNYLSSVVLQVRTTGDPWAMVAAVQAEVRALDKDLPVFRSMTIGEHLRGTLLAPRLAATLLGIFGLIAMLLAAIGIYGVVAYAVNQRTREIGIRLALGARSRDVAWIVLRRSLLPVWVGMLIGVGAALAATRLLSGFLYGISAADPLTFTVVALLLGAVALSAAYFPTRRAVKVDPMIALREF